MAAFLMMRRVVYVSTPLTKLACGSRCLATSCFSTTTQLVESTTSTVATVSPVGADGSPRYKGASLDKRTGKWKATITVNGKRMHLGSFDDPKVASDAYFAAKAVYSSKPRKGRCGHPHASTSAAAAQADDRHAVEENDVVDNVAVGASQNPPLSKYIGVLKDGPDTEMWEAVITVNNKEISGGEYDSQEDAAKAYDALARMYLGADATTNFPMDSYSAWIPPDEVVTTGQIETKLGVHLTVEEIVKALQQERGIDITTINLAGKSDLAEQMIFVTGKTVTHMQKMANMLSRSLRKRRIPGVDPGVEGLDMDDWMVVDAGNIIINIMDAEAREVFDLENFYNNMKIGEDPYAGMTYDEWLERNPIPEKWLKRLEKDEMEMEAQQRVSAPPLQSDRSPTMNFFHKGPKNKVKDRYA